jgi:acyl-CoA synthetase (AMP-forming)/AMP-acid ligase II
MGKVDDEGFVFVEDRIKDMIISGGENIYSPEIERVLAEHPAVMEVAIIGVPDDRWGETVKAVVSLKPDTTATADELIAYCREHLATYKCPTSVDILGALPRNPTGKIMKRELRTAVLGGPGPHDRLTAMRFAGAPCRILQPPIDARARPRPRRPP